jgi:hypothetical protein
LFSHLLPNAIIFSNQRQITHRLTAAQTAYLLPGGTLSAQIECPDDEMRSKKNN